MISRRLFVGIPISAEIKDKIKSLSAKLQETGADLNLVSLENLHLTLKFLGQIEEEQIADIKKRLAGVAEKELRFVIKIKKVNTFSSGSKLRVVFIEAESAQLVSLRNKIDLVLNNFKKDDHANTAAHLTLARVQSEKNKPQLQVILTKFRNQDFGEMLADHFILYSSTLTRKGPIYEELARFFL